MDDYQLFRIFVIANLSNNNMEEIDYHKLLNEIFKKRSNEVKKNHLNDWNYQKKGKLFFKGKKGGISLKECKPLSWETEFRIAKHPYKDIYAYASSKCPGIENNMTSCICLYNENDKSNIKILHDVGNYPKHGFDLKPAFSPDGKWIAFLSLKKYGIINKVGDVLVVPYNSDGKDVINLTEKLSISGACREFQWPNNNTNTLLVEYCEKGYSKVCSISFKPNNPSIVVEMKVLGNYKLSIKVERDNQKYIRDFNSQKFYFLKNRLVKHCKYRTSDGVTSYYWFVYPEQQYSNGRTLLLCLGGPHNPWEPGIECGSYHIPLLVHLGYSIIMPIVRGMPGISQKFDDQVRGDWGGQCIQDYIYALNTAIKDFDLDINNVAIMGHSFGGFCAYSMNVLHPDRFRCVVSESGPFNLKLFLIDSLKYNKIKGCIRNQTMVSEMYNGLANPQGEMVADKMIREQSPHNLIKNRKDRCKPILIIHGEDDTRVSRKQAKEAQKRFGGNLFLYKGEGHVIDKKVENKIDRYLRILEFLDTHMT